jgi:hypothetical protein
LQVQKRKAHSLLCCFLIFSRTPNKVPDTPILYTPRLRCYDEHRALLNLDLTTLLNRMPSVARTYFLFLSVRVLFNAARTANANRR